MMASLMNMWDSGILRLLLSDTKEPLESRHSADFNMEMQSALVRVVRSSPLEVLRLSIIFSLYRSVGESFSDSNKGLPCSMADM